MCFFYFLVRNDANVIIIDGHNNVVGFGVHT